MHVFWIRTSVLDQNQYSVLCFRAEKETWIRQKYVEKQFVRRSVSHVDSKSWCQPVPQLVRLDQNLLVLLYDVSSRVSSSEPDVCLMVNKDAASSQGLREMKPLCVCIGPRWRGILLPWRRPWPKMQKSTVASARKKVNRR